MTKIEEHITMINKANKKALTIFITAGFPSKINFVDLALSILNSGADILEIGIPFSDSLADGPVIQSSYQTALANRVTINDVFIFCEKIKSKTDKPLILMGDANPIIKFGTKLFCERAFESGVSGLIVPNIPIDEYDSFYSADFNNFEKILLTTPTSTDERIKEIDKKSEGFVYCVSVKGTTGVRNKFDSGVLKNLERTYSLVTKNKMQIGFGISNPENIKTFSPYCDGVIIGSAVVKKIEDDKSGYELPDFISSLGKACNY